MTSAVRWLVTVLAGDVASTPRLCDGCGRTWRRLTPAQAAQVGSDRLPTCRRFRCTGRLWPVWPEATDRLIRDLRTNGAPVVETGTPPNQAVPTEGATAMAHTLQSETTPRGKQILAAITLGHLLETDPLTDVPDAPPVEWRIDAAGRIHGHVHDPWNEARARSAMHTIAGFLGLNGVARSQGRNARSEWVHLSVSATYRGVPVNVWTHVAIRVTNPYGSTR